MWKCVPRNIRESVERRVTRKISRSEKLPGQEIKQVSTLQTRVTSPATQNVISSSSADCSDKRFAELRKCSWDSYNISKLSKTFGGDPTDSCRIISTIIPCLNQRFSHFGWKGFNVGSENKINACGWKKQRKGKQQERTWNNGSHIEHSWLGAVGWSTVLVLGWYMIQPLCRLWVFPCDKERKCSKRCRFLLNIDGRDKRSDAHYVSLVDVVSRTALAQPLSVLSQQQAEKLALLDEADSITASGQVTNTYSETNGATQLHISPVPFGPRTAEEALDDAAENFLKVHNTAVGEVDNSLGVSLMQQGRHKEAVAFFTRGMEYSNPAAAFNLAVCYEKGLGTSQDLKKAAKYYRVASERGHSTAMYNLGVFHVHGWGGLPVDFNQACALFEKASVLGQSDAKRALDMVTPSNPVRQVDNIAYDESANILLQALGLGKYLNGECNTEELKDHSLCTSEMHEESVDFVRLSNNSQLDVKDLTQLIEDTVSKYKMYH